MSADWPSGRGRRSFSRGGKARRILAALAVLILAALATGQSGSAASQPGVTSLPGTGGQQIATPHQLLAPEKARTAAEKAVQAISANDREEARRQLSRALDIYPSYAVALTLRGLLQLREGRTAAATADLEEAVRVDPAYGLPRVVLGSIYNDAQRYDDALQLLPRAVGLLPFVWQSHFELARSLYGKEDYVAALREVNEALRLTSSSEAPENRAYVHYLRGHVLVQLTDFPSAKEEFELTLKEDPDGELGAPSRRALELLRAAGP